MPHNLNETACSAISIKKLLLFWLLRRRFVEQRDERCRAWCGSQSIIFGLVYSLPRENFLFWLPTQAKKFKKPKKFHSSSKHPVVFLIRLWCFSHGFDLAWKDICIRWVDYNQASYFRRLSVSVRISSGKLPQLIIPVYRDKTIPVQVMVAYCCRSDGRRWWRRGRGGPRTGL